VRTGKRSETNAAEGASIDFLARSKNLFNLKKKKKKSFLSGRRGLPGSVRALRAAVVNSVTSNGASFSSSSSSATASEAAAAAAGAPPPRRNNDGDEGGGGGDRAAFLAAGGAGAAAEAGAQQRPRRDASTSPPPPTRSASEPRMARFDALLHPPGPASSSGGAVDLRALRELAWSGVPPRLRGTVWKLLLGYLPAERSRRRAFLARKRAEYAHFIPAHYEGAAAAGAAARGGGGANGGGGGGAGGSGGPARGGGGGAAPSAAAASLLLQPQHLSEEAAALRQVQVDAPRTAPGVPLFARPDVQRALVRLLYLWGVRHPASGYVQGINDLATPLLAAFFADAAAGDGDGVGSSSSRGGGGRGGEGGSNDFSAGGRGGGADAAGSPLLSPDDPAWQGVALPEGAAEAAEADAYWCLCRLLEGVQDHYTHGQPGIRRCAAAVDELVARVDAPLARHLQGEGVECLQFAFRWANCLLAREMPLRAAMRLFDTWVAEGASGVAAGQGGGGGGGGAGATMAGGGGPGAHGRGGGAASAASPCPSLPPSSSSLADFLAYACASFLVGWREELVRLDFQGAVMFLQRPPTARWGEADVEPVLSRAFLWRAQFGGAPSHLGRR